MRSFLVSTVSTDLLMILDEHDEDVDSGPEVVRIYVFFASFMMGCSHEARKMSQKDLLRHPDRNHLVLTKKEQEALAKYKESLGDHFAFQLNQNPQHRALHSKMVNGMPTLMTLIHNLGIVWFEGRILVPVELALYQGLAVRKDLSLPRLQSCPTSRELTTCSFSVQSCKGKSVQRSRTTMAGQVGNGMNVAVVGAFVHLDCQI